MAENERKRESEIEREGETNIETERERGWVGRGWNETRRWIMDKFQGLAYPIVDPIFEMSYVYRVQY